MIDYKDLRVGNKVYYDTGEGNEVCTIDGTDISVMESRENYAKRHSPIPLTPELLIDCGFKWHESKCHNDEIWLRKIDGSWEWSFVGSGLFISSQKLELKFVHQLQNLYFALTGTELIYTPKQ